MLKYSFGHSCGSYLSKSLKVSDIKCPSVSKVPVKISHTGVYVCESTDNQSRIYFIWRLMKQPADWKQLLDNQQVSRVSRWAGSAGELWSQRLSAPLKARLNSLARPAPFAHLCERAVKKKGSQRPDCGTSAVFRRRGEAWPLRHAGAAPSPLKATFFYSHVLPEQTALLSGPVPALTGHCPGNMHCCSMQIRSHWDRGSGRGHPELSSRDRGRRPANKWKFALNPRDNRGRGWGRASKPR